MPGVLQGTWPEKPEKFRANARVVARCSWGITTAMCNGVLLRGGLAGHKLSMALLALLSYHAPAAILNVLQ